ncbi:MAG: hypothetical protein IT313_08795 [Anaerolineales bacterium]|nr:hypothetical protein [Anaerolineales bacterium]
MTKRALGYARMGARNKITGLADLSLTDIKKIYRDEYQRVVAELKAWNQSKVESWKAWNESKFSLTEQEPKMGDASEDDQVSK